MNRSIYFLKSFEEAHGNLSEVAEIDGYHTATIGGVCVAIPSEIAAKLQHAIGTRVGLLKADNDFRLKFSDEHA
jgi:hypothetical protein